MRYENAELKATATKAVVPPTVKIGTTTYKVTAIAPKAFMGYSKLRTVTVGYNVGVLRPGAFAEAASLKKLNIQTSQLTMKKTKKALQNSVVESVTVPATKLSDYKAIFAKAHSGSAKKVTVAANGTASASNETDTTSSTSANNNQKQDSTTTSDTTTGNTTNSSNQQQSTTSNTTSDASDDNSSQQDTASDASDSNDQDAASNTSDSSSQ